MTTDPTPTAVSSTLPSARPWYAEGTTADFSMSDLFAFAQVLDNLGAFEGVSDVLYYFEKPWKWTGERARWVEVGSMSQPDEDQAEYILDNGTKSASYEEWKAQRDGEEEEMAAEVKSIVGGVVKRASISIEGRASRVEGNISVVNFLAEVSVDGKSAGTLSDFIAANETLTTEHVAALDRLEVGQSLLIGRETVTRTK